MPYIVQTFFRGETFYIGATGDIPCWRLSYHTATRFDTRQSAETALQNLRKRGRYLRETFDKATIKDVNS